MEQPRGQPKPLSSSKQDAVFGFVPCGMLLHTVWFEAPLAEVIDTTSGSPKPEAILRPSQGLKVKFEGFEPHYGELQGLRACHGHPHRARENSTMFAGSSDPHRSPVTALLGISIFSLRRRVCPQASCRKWLLLCSALSAGLQFIAFRVGFAWPIQATATAPSTPFRQHPIRGTTAYLRFGYAGYIDVAQIRSKPRLTLQSLHSDAR